MAFADFYSSELAPDVQLAFQTLYAQLRAFVGVSFNEDGSLIPAQPNAGVSPIGTITMFGGASAPSKWLLCDGTAHSRVTYKDLFAVVGTTYGAGDGSTTFGLPDLRQRFPMGKAAAGTGATLGETGGSIDHTHSVPGLSVPGLSVPGLSVPALSIPTRSVSGSTGTGTTGSGTSGDESAHTHGIGIVPVIAVPIGVQQVGTSTGNIGLQTQNGNATGAGSAHSHSVPGLSVPSLSVSATAASGSTGTGTTGTGTTGTGTTGTGTSGSTNPPFVSVNFIILAGV